jgi:hypothetical protein
MDMKIKALSAKYEAAKAEAEANFEVYLENAVGVGEHPNIIEEMDLLISKWSDANGKYESLLEMMKIIAREKS